MTGFRRIGRALVIVTPVAFAAPASLQDSTATPARFVSWFSGDSFSGWTIEHKAAGAATAANGVMTVTERAGWVRIERVIGAFALRLDARMATQSGSAVLVIRGHGASRDALGYALPLASAAAPLASTPKLTRLDFSPGGLAHALSRSDEWHTYEVRCLPRRVTATVNGELVLAQSDPMIHDGWIGIHAEGGTVELRNIQLGPANDASPEISNGPYLPGNGVTMPILIREVKPEYTAEAMRAKIAGAVLLECVIETDGTVHDLRILRSLDATFGLDYSAIKAASQWRFKPGLKDGAPVPVLATIEMSFTIGK